MSKEHPFKTEEKREAFVENSKRLSEHYVEKVDKARETYQKMDSNSLGLLFSLEDWELWSLRVKQMGRREQWYETKGGERDGQK